MCGSVLIGEMRSCVRNLFGLYIEMVKGIRLSCRSERKVMGYCKEVDIDLNDHHDVSPVPFSIARGTPFAVVKTTPCVENDSDGNVNQHATYMNIEMICTGRMAR